MDPGRLQQTGVTMFRLEGGKIRHVKDCILDQEVIATAYPHNGGRCGRVERANHTMIDAFTAPDDTLRTLAPAPLGPERLPKHVRYLCATPRRRSCVARAHSASPYQHGRAYSARTAR